MRGTICGLAFVVTAFLFPTVTRANGITLTLNNPNVTVIEGNSFTLSLTLANNTGQDVTAIVGVPYDAIGPVSFSGDPSDFYFFPPIVIPDPGGTCPGSGGTLPAGSSCSYSITLGTPTDTGETGADSGVWGVRPEFIFNDATGHEAFVDSNVGTVTVMDPTAVPEPSSLLLLGTGLLGLAPFVRSRLARHERVGPIFWKAYSRCGIRPTKGNDTLCHTPGGFGPDKGCVSVGFFGRTCSD